MTTITRIDAGALRRAYSDRDAEALLALYADDATVEVIDHLNQPSPPRVIRGRAVLPANLNAVFASDRTNDVVIVASAGAALGYVARCTCADGTKVVCAATAEV